MVSSSCPQSEKNIVISIARHTLTVQNGCKLAKFYAGLLSPGDEILAINGLRVRDLPMQEVQKMFSHAEMVRLTVLPKPWMNSN